MKVITLNTWQERGPWERRWEIILQGLEKYRPEVVCFQEVFNEVWAVSLPNKTGLPYFYYPESPSGLLILSKHPIIQTDYLRLPTQSPTETYFRYLIYAAILIGDNPVRIFNTHLSWLPEEGIFRERQASEMLDFINSKGLSKESIMMGDFNAPPTANEIMMIKAQGWKDSYTIKHPDIPGCTWANDNPFAAGSSHVLPDRRIDYIFYQSQEISLKNLRECTMIWDKPESDALYASDHFGLLAEFN
ncbi:MAG: hypothetical protein EXS63_00400 [Candidatus Omnitrophica bacterium]|nr:hypothetical protein [Candidatus Omnitrophota bacterium]